MIYLLDTNVCIEAIRRPHGAISRRVRAMHESEVAISAATLGEMLIGPLRQKRPKDHDEGRRLAFFTDAIKTLDFDPACAAAFARLAAAAMDNGRPIGPVDLQIAATAIVHNLILVTHNRKHFAAVGGLEIQDWQGDTNP